MNNRNSQLTEELIERRNRSMGKAYRLFYEQPLNITHAEDVWLYDADGRKHLDVYNNVPHVGHCHPHVVDAVARQSKTLNIHTRYLNETVISYAERLTALFPAGLDIAMFACSGTEANELALRLARAKTGATGMIVTDHAYHGTSWAIAEITTAYEGHEKRGDNIVTIPSPDSYRGAYAGDPDAAAKYAGHVSEAISELQRRGHQPAALIVDTIFSNEGIPDVPPGFMRLAVEQVHAAGGVFVADEVQAGFGRLGAEMWGFLTHGVTPDIVTMGKPMGNGYPISAVITTERIVEAFQNKSHYFNTFGGNPVACAAASAVLDVMEKEQLQANSLEVGRYLMAGLTALANEQSLIGDLRGSGLFIGIDLVLDQNTREPATKKANQAVNLLKERGVLLGVTGVFDNILKIRPPLTFSKQHADLLLANLKDVLALLQSANMK